jgi:hypothetical protein
VAAGAHDEHRRVVERVALEQLAQIPWLTAVVEGSIEPMYPGTTRKQ